jgi:eukaryotic-like serine/threonine-protein kinase
VTTRTDIYALGLVMYEMFTGRRALIVSEGAPHSAATTSPSTYIVDLDPAIDRIIVRCLERDPSRRPPSVIAVAAALPGGNLLAAALAAGETPSPDLVAAAGETGTLSPAVGGMCFAGVLLGLVLFALLGRNVNLIGLTNAALSPQLLTERTHTILRNLGYADAAADEATGYTTDIDYLRSIDEYDRSPSRWQALASPQPAALLFWHRHSPQTMIPIGGTNIVTQVNPPPTRSGMVSLTLDRTGRLVSLIAVPPQVSGLGESSVSTSPPIWMSLFEQAGLSLDRLSPAPSQWVPPVFADTRSAWQGAYPDRPDVPIRIEAAAAFGKPVYFEIVAPWTRPRNAEPQPANTSGERVGLYMRSAVAPVAITLAVLLAVRNLRSGRGDRRGAMRLAIFLMAAGATSNALETGDLQVLTRGPTLIFFVASFAWLLYIALEPLMRRLSPELMIGWSRLLAGHVRDPLVGRDVLVGTLVAMGDGVLLSLHWLLRQWTDHPSHFPIGASSSPFDGMAASSDLLLGGRYALSRIIGTVMSIPAWSGTMMLFLFVIALYVLVRRRAFAIAASILALTAIYVVTHGGWLLAYAPADHFPPSFTDVGVFAAAQTAVVLIAVRFGLLTMLVASFVSLLLTLMPIAVDAATPYASSSRLIVATVMLMAAYGWHTALAGRPLFGALLPKDQPARSA